MGSQAALVSAFNLPEFICGGSFSAIFAAWLSVLARQLFDESRGMFHATSIHSFAQIGNRTHCPIGIFQRQKHDAFESLDEISFKVANGFESPRQGQPFRGEKSHNRDSEPFADESYNLLCRLKRDHFVFAAPGLSQGEPQVEQQWAAAHLRVVRPAAVRADADTSPQQGSP